MTRAERSHNTLEPPSRFWIQQMCPTEDTWRAWADALDCCAEEIRLSRPAPTPPVHARPAQLSVTQIEAWIRDPYQIYAEEILKIRPLDPLDAGLQTTLFGTLVHQTLDRFTKGGSAQDDEAFQRLRTLGEDVFGDLLTQPIVRHFWWARFLNAGAWWLGIERLDPPHKSFSEVKGATVISLPRGDFTLKAKADRLDLMAQSTCRIIDYKTGIPPTPRAVRQGLSPQLPLEGAIVMRGGFVDLGVPQEIELRYLHLSGGKKPGAVVDLKDSADLIASSWARLVALVEHYQDPATPYYAWPTPAYVSPHTWTKHLARVDEWTL